MAGAVLLVAAIAAVVSYLHIERLALSHGQPWLAAVLLPISVDGTITAASLALLWAARAGVSSPWLARLMLSLGVLATVAANAVEGASGGTVGVLVSAWPAVAFIGGIELLVWTARSARLAAPANAPVTMTATAFRTAPEPSRPAVSGAAVAAPAAVSRPRPASAPKRGTAVSPEAKAEQRYADLLAAGGAAEHPGRGQGLEGRRPESEGDQGAPGGSGGNMTLALASDRWLGRLVLGHADWENRSALDRHLVRLSHLPCLRWSPTSLIRLMLPFLATPWSSGFGRLTLIRYFGERSWSSLEPVATALRCSLRSHGPASLRQSCGEGCWPWPS